MEITDGHIVYYAGQSGVVTEAVPYERDGGRLIVDGQELTLKTLTNNQLTIIDGDQNELIFKRDEETFSSLKNSVFGNISTDQVISNALDCEPAVWTATPGSREIQNGETLELSISKSAGVSGSVEVWFFTLPKTPATAEEAYHLVSVDNGCDAGETTLQTRITNQTDEPAEIEIRLRRPTLNLQVGSEDFRVLVQ